MKKPVVGQVLATRNGEQFLVEDVFSTFNPDDEGASPDDFAVQLAPVKGLHAVQSDWEMDALFHDEFEEWCKRNGVSY
ncbi:hypothetical protein [Comamonas sp. NoAH]|uniref:hypothetical protein n=1 Tax=Comamonas halotolerans TaxID=3041496 RepID=UPI0024E085FF|nr:hypothetical protein [Comamonas sp. NoAH]